MMRNGYKKKSKGTKETQTLYHWLDNGNNKKALQEADKVLKRQPDLHCVRALKCIALSRLGKEADCIELLESVRKEKNLDEATLQAMTVCYREIHRPELICELYKSVYLEDPQNEEVLSHLFMAYVRVSDYKSQQHTATTLYKLSQKTQMYYRAVVSILLQIGIRDIMYYCLPPLYREKGPEPNLSNQSNVLLVKLAERMMIKFLTNVEREQEVELYLIILKMRGDQQAVLDALEEPLGSLLEVETLLAHKVDTYMKMGRWIDAWDILKTMLACNPDGWDILLHFLDVCFKTGDETTLEETKKFLEDQCEGNKNPTRRGPILAKIELNSRLKAKGGADDAVPLFMDYINAFGYCECCFQDLQCYLKDLTKDEAVELLQKICEKVQLGENCMPKDKTQMNLHISNMEIATGLSVPSSPSFVTNCLNYFIHSQSFYKDTLSTEVRSSDRYALLAAHSLYRSWLDTNDNYFLHEAIIICHYALTYSPWNSQLKLLLVKFYTLLGCAAGSQTAYTSLEIKHMQLDSLGYLNVFPVLALGHYSAASSGLNSTAKFFIQNYKDSAEHVIFAYKCNTYARIPEFISIKERLSNSLHFMMVSVERILLEVVQSSSFVVTTQVVNDLEAAPHLDKLQWANLQDNRDLNVMWEYGEGKVPQSIREKSYHQELILFQVRHLILKVINAVLHLPQSPLDSEPRKNLIHWSEELNRIAEDLKVNHPSVIGREFIGSPPDSRLLILVETNYLSLFVDLISFFIEIDKCNKEATEQRMNTILAYFTSLLDLLSHSRATDNFSQMTYLIKFSAVYVELISFAVVFLGGIDALITQVKQTTSAKKTRKKKENSPTPPPVVASALEDLEWRQDIYRKMSAALSDNMSSVETILASSEASCKALSFSSYLTERLEDDCENQKIQSVANNVNETLSHSYVTSFSQLHCTLKLKLKYLKH